MAFHFKNLIRDAAMNFKQFFFIIFMSTKLLCMDTAIDKAIEPVMLSVLEDNMEQLQNLIESNANLDSISQFDGIFYTPLIMAISLLNMQAIHLLLNSTANTSLKVTLYINRKPIRLNCNALKVTKRYALDLDIKLIELIDESSQETDKQRNELIEQRKMLNTIICAIKGKLKT